MWGHYKSLYFNSCKAQSILELAVFGSILIMLLGILVSYGLKYNYQQQAMQEAFRSALDLASDPNEGSASYTVMKDRHIPNPSDTFGIGQVTPIIGSAGITLSNKMDETADNDGELPKTMIQIPDASDPKKFKVVQLTTAGFREDNNVAKESIVKYIEIYGNSIQGCEGFNAQGCISTKWGPAQDNENLITQCIEYGAPDQVTGVPSCAKSAIVRIRFIDPNAGEAMNYESAVKQCRQIVDKEVCKKECLRGSETDAKCTTICSHDIQIPWYCQNYAETNAANHQYTFPEIEKIFSGLYPKSLGLQQGYTQKTTIEGQPISLETREDNSGIINVTDTEGWKTVTTRTIIRRAPGETAGTIPPEEVSGAVSIPDENKTSTWQTKW